MTALFSDSALPRRPQEIYPGCMHVPGWLDVEQQQFLLRQFFTWGEAPRVSGRGILPHHPDIFGNPMSVRMTSLGWHWENFEYTRTAPSFQHAEPLAVPDWLKRLGRQALRTAYRDEIAPSWPRLGSGLADWANSFDPDIAVVNYYSPTARMGMHQDREEKVSMPIVSVSLGDTAIFRAGNTQAKTRPWKDLPLASGDLVVFGGTSRFMFHAVPKILPGTVPDFLTLPQGRVNITLRQTGM